MTATVRVVRGGRTEAVHHASIVITDAAGAILGSAGDPDTPFYSRSSLKPFQAQVSQRLGADLSGETLALACASHGGTPEHLAVVERMLAEVGLSEADLATPPAWPSEPDGRDAAIRAGATEPRRLFHNCSGKHAGKLRACLASGLPTETYLSPSHPLQVAIADELADLTGERPEPPTVDGCGAPIYLTTTAKLAAMFAVLATDPDRDAVRSAMRDHPALIGAKGRIDGVVGAATGGASKIGAEGCLGIALPEQGVGIAIKIWDGSYRGLEPLVAATLEHMGLLNDELAAALEVPVLGGGRTMGWLEADVEWTA